MMRLLLLVQMGTADGTQAMNRLHAMVGDAIGCRAARPGEVVVCARDRSAASPYRLPTLPGEDGFQVDGPRDSVSRERHRLLDVGGAGAQQKMCSNTGPGGLYGCEVQRWKEADEQRGFQRPQ